MAGCTTTGSTWTSIRCSLRSGCHRQDGQRPHRQQPLNADAAHRRAGRQCPRAQQHRWDRHGGSPPSDLEPESPSRPPLLDRPQRFAVIQPTRLRRCPQSPQRRCFRSGAGGARTRQPVGSLPAPACLDSGRRACQRSGLTPALTRYALRRFADAWSRVTGAARQRRRRSAGRTACCRSAGPAGSGCRSWTPTAWAGLSLRFRRHNALLCVMVPVSQGRAGRRGRPSWPPGNR
jgi:hypothetical protein